MYSNAYQTFSLQDVPCASLASDPSFIGELPAVAAFTGMGVVWETLVPPLGSTLIPPPPASPASPETGAPEDETFEEEDLEDDEEIVDLEIDEETLKEKAKPKKGSVYSPFARASSGQQKKYLDRMWPLK